MNIVHIAHNAYFCIKHTTLQQYSEWYYVHIVHIVHIMCIVHIVHIVYNMDIVYIVHTVHIVHIVHLVHLVHLVHIVSVITVVFNKLYSPKQYFAKEMSFPKNLFSKSWF